MRLIDADKKKGGIEVMDYDKFGFVPYEFFTTPARTGVPKIKTVIFNRPATIVLWGDGTKTVVKCQAGDEFSKELGLAMCICKRALGNKSNYNEVFKEWAYETN